MGGGLRGEADKVVGRPGVNQLFFIIISVVCVCVTLNSVKQYAVWTPMRFDFILDVGGDCLKSERETHTHTETGPLDIFRVLWFGRALLLLPEFSRWEFWLVILLLLLLPPL